MALRRNGSSTVSNAAMASTPRATCSSYKRLHCELMRPSPLRRMVSNSQRAPSFVISSTCRHGGRTSRCDYLAMAEWHECRGTDGSFHNGKRRDRMRRMSQFLLPSFNLAYIVACGAVALIVVRRHLVR